MENPWKEARPPLVVSLVSTVGEDGRPNASPKSWWSPVSYQPPILMVAIKPLSDSNAYIQQTGLFVLHIPPQPLAQQVLHTAKPLPRGEMELDDVHIPWEWLEHEKLERPLPYIPSIPWFACWVLNYQELGDHVMYVAQVGLGGGFGEEGIDSACVHRGRNVFMDLGDEYQVVPY